MDFVEDIPERPREERPKRIRPDRSPSTDSSINDEHGYVRARLSQSIQGFSKTTGQISELASIVKNLAETIQVQSTSSPPSLAQPGTSRPHVRGEAIPRFYPDDDEQDILKWINKIDELRNIFNWSDEITSYYAMEKLRGLASTWYKGLTSIKFTWEAWKDKLIRAFPHKKDYCSLLEHMLARKKRPEEPLAKFFYEKNVLVSSCSITGTNAVSCIVGGLLDENIKTIARAGNYQNPEELLEFLKNCEKY
ncbi:hypothetical protein CBL_05092 [Carabus blaptoides fortunei]